MVPHYKVPPILKFVQEGEGGRIDWNQSLAGQGYCLMGQDFRLRGSQAADGGDKGRTRHAQFLLPNCTVQSG